VEREAMGVIKILLLGAAGVLMGCQMSPPAKTYNLVLKGEAGQAETISYFTKSIVKQSTTDQITREKHEETSFTVQVRTEHVDKSSGHLHQTVVVTEKEGPMELNDMAFPQLNEKMDVIYTPDAKVIKAGAYPPGGVFYVPPISLPERAVEIGETWNMQSQWRNFHNGIVMQLDLVTIFKSLVACGEAEQCADLEVSGKVSLPQLRGDFTLENQLRGRILFAINKGGVIWSEIHNKEIFQSEDLNVETESCLRSLLKDAKTFKKLEGQNKECEVPRSESITPPLEI
jgi:hypothetical protein